MRPIDADKLTELCDIMADKCGETGESIWGQFRATVEWSPTIDPVVHCADCKYAIVGYYCGERYWTCDNNEGLYRDVPDDGFCYCGAYWTEEKNDF